MEICILIVKIRQIKGKQGAELGLTGSGTNWHIMVAPRSVHQFLLAHFSPPRFSSTLPFTTLSFLHTGLLWTQNITDSTASLSPSNCLPLGNKEYIGELRNNQLDIKSRCLEVQLQALTRLAGLSLKLCFIFLWRASGRQSCLWFWSLNLKAHFDQFSIWS